MPPTQIGLLSHIEYIYTFVFLVLNLKTMSLSNLKIMTKSLITEYSVVFDELKITIHDFLGGFC